MLLKENTTSTSGKQAQNVCYDLRAGQWMAAIGVPSLMYGICSTSNSEAAHTLSRWKRELSWSVPVTWLVIQVKKINYSTKRNHCQLFEERLWTSREFLFDADDNCKLSDRDATTTPMKMAFKSLLSAWHQNCRIFCNTAHPSRSSVPGDSEYRKLSNSSSPAGQQRLIWIIYLKQWHAPVTYVTETRWSKPPACRNSWSNWIQPSLPRKGTINSMIGETSSCKDLGVNICTSLKVALENPVKRLL